jgi:AAA+ superfamily predicted ATPase
LCNGAAPCFIFLSIGNLITGLNRSRFKEFKDDVKEMIDGVLGLVGGEAE